MIEVLDNKKQIIEEINTPKKHSNITIDISQWKEGLYYWRLMDNRNLYHLGKFKKVKEKK